MSMEDQIRTIMACGDGDEQAIEAAKQIEEMKIEALRDEFAKAALTGMISSSPVVDRSSVDKEKWSEIAYDWAFAMLEARKK